MVVGSGGGKEVAAGVRRASEPQLLPPQHAANSTSNSGSGKLDRGQHAGGVLWGEFAQHGPCTAPHKSVCTCECVRVAPACTPPELLRVLCQVPPPTPMCGVLLLVVLGGGCCTGSLTATDAPVGLQATPTTTQGRGCVQQTDHLREGEIISMGAEHTHTHTEMSGRDV